MESVQTFYDTNLKNKQSALKYYKKFLGSNPSEKQNKYIAYAKSRIEALSHWRCISRATYLPMISNSRLTVEPVRTCCRLVCSKV